MGFSKIFFVTIINWISLRLVFIHTSISLGDPNIYEWLKYCVKILAGSLMKNPGKTRSKTVNQIKPGWSYLPWCHKISSTKKESNGFVKSCFDAELIDSFISQTYMCTRNWWTETGLTKGFNSRSWCESIPTMVGISKFCPEIMRQVLSNLFFQLFSTFFNLFIYFLTH